MFVFVVFVCFLLKSKLFVWLFAHLCDCSFACFVVRPFVVSFVWFVCLFVGSFVHRFLRLRFFLLFCMLVDLFVV